MTVATNETIADFPAIRIYKTFDGRKFKHGDKIALPFETKRYGTMWHRFTLGTVAGYAIENGECPFKATESSTGFGHDQYWINANASTISNRNEPKVEMPGFNWGDEIILQGKTFRIEKANNQNAMLIEV